MKLSKAKSGSVEEMTNLIEDDISQQSDNDEDGWGRKAIVRQEMSKKNKKAKVALLKDKLVAKIEALKKRRMGAKYGQDGGASTKKSPRKPATKSPKRESKKVRRLNNQKKQPKGEKAKERSNMKNKLKLARGGKRKLVNEDSD